MSKTTRKSYMQYVIYKYSCWSSLILLFLDCSLLSFLFLVLPLLAFPFLAQKLERSKKTLSVQECERERIMRKLQNRTDKSYQLILISLFINEASIFFIFHYFPSFSSSHGTCDLSPSFSPTFLYFHK